MPTVRTRRTHTRIGLGPIEREHLELGDAHLLAPGPDGCWICRRGVGEARWLWQEHRDEILREWRYGFPCFGSIVYDRVQPSDTEPAHVGDRTILAMIRAAAAAALAE